MRSDSWFTGHDGPTPQSIGRHEFGAAGYAADATRESIAKFLDAEARKFTQALEEHMDTERPNDAYEQTSWDMKTARLDGKRSVLTTMAAYIRRGDDKAGA